MGELLFFSLLLLTGIHAWFYPSFWQGFSSYLSPAFAITMLFLGTLIEPEHLKALPRKSPWVVLGLLLQYTLMPLSGFLVSFLFQEEQLKLGTLLVGVMPGAMASNVVTVLMGGDLLLSVLMTTLATLLAPLILLLWFPLLSGGITLKVPLGQMAFSTLTMVVLPVVAGILFRFRHRELGEGWRLFARTLATLTIVFIIASVVAQNHGLIETGGGRVLFAMLLLNLLGGTLAFLGTAPFSTLPLPARATIIVEVAMQNAGLGSVLALKHLSPTAALPSAIYTPLCVLTALAFAFSLRARLKGSAAIP